VPMPIISFINYK